MPHPCRPAALVLAACIALALVTGPSSSQAQTAGAYLAAREAGARNDFAASPPFLDRLLQADPENPMLLNSLLVNLVVLGEQEHATEIATRLRALDPGNEVAGLVLVTDAFARDEHAAVLDLLAAGPIGNHLIDALAPAWAQLGQGSMTEALETLDNMAARDGMAAFGLYSRALALALAGDAEGALAVIEAPEHGIGSVLNRRGIIAHAQLMALADRTEDALALIDDVFVEPWRDPRLAGMIDAYQQGRPVPFDVISGPGEGMAEVFAVLATVMRQSRNPQDGLLFARLALALNPALSDTQLLLGQLFEDLEQPELAAQSYAEVPADDFFGISAAMGEAQTLFSLDRAGEALAVTEALAERYPDMPAVWHVLGDFRRFDDRIEGAVQAYGRAIDLIRAQGREPGWQLLHSRALMHHRLGDWPAAEADFRAALADEPDQPTVLNNFAYSMVERQENLDEALEMIRRAVEAEPDSGYFVDSLAWALFRMGRYDEAVPHMERAVELLPSDPILNDHLGDVYWAVGRHREARFQWRRALSFGPHDDLDMDRVRRKLDIGLDQVLAEDGEAPLHGAE